MSRVDPPAPAAAAAMDPTGERMVPESSHPLTFWEHIYRYAFASPLARGRRVLDIACGEGYGSAALLRAGATSLVGVDIDEVACDHARAKYGGDARVGSAEHIPVPDGSVDLVVSFETIEHVPDPTRFLDECHRVLVPGGRLVVSTPNKDVYRRVDHGGNPYHCSEMTEAEFTAALNARFDGTAVFGQRPISAPWWRGGALRAEQNPWGLIRGAGRLRRALQRRFAPEAFAPPTAAERADVVGLIAGRAGRTASAFNPFAVQRRSGGDAEEVVYLVAVAGRRG
jgi:SAM-dependent methyltransferase